MRIKYKWQSIRKALILLLYELINAIMIRCEITDKQKCDFSQGVFMDILYWLSPKSRNRSVGKGFWGRGTLRTQNLMSLGNLKKGRRGGYCHKAGTLMVLTATGYRFLSFFYAPGTVLSTLHKLSHLILLPHKVIEEENRAHSCYIKCSPFPLNYPQQFRPKRYSKILHNNDLIFQMEKLRPKKLWAFTDTVQPVRRRLGLEPGHFPLKVGANAPQKLRGYYSLWSLCKWCLWSTKPLSGPQHEWWFLELHHLSPWLGFVPGCSPHSRRKLLRQKPQAPKDWTLPSLPTILSKGVYPFTMQLALLQHTSRGTRSVSALGTPSCPWGSLCPELPPEPGKAV